MSIGKTKEQYLAELESAHKEQFLNIVKATHFFLNYIQWKGKDITPAEIDNLKKLRDTGLKLANQWYERQSDLEKYKIPQVPKIAFFDVRTVEQLDGIAAKWATPKGIGFIPLIIWGSVAVIGLLSIAYITRRITDTATEKTELINATKDAAEKLNLTPEQATELLNRSATTSGVFGTGFMTALVPVILGAVAIMNADKIFSLFKTKSK